MYIIVLIIIIQYSITNRINSYDLISYVCTFNFKTLMNYLGKTVASNLNNYTANN